MAKLPLRLGKFMRNTLALWIALLGISLAGAAASEPPILLIVDAEGFADTEGLAVLRVYDSVENLMKAPPKLSRQAQIRNGAAHFELPDFPSGTWAFLVFQDRNGNNDVDHGWNRFPVEPLGYSRGFVPGLHAGMPSFGKAAVAIKGPTDTLRLTVARIDFKTFFRGKSQ